MSHNRGADLGGVRTIADIRDRCRIDDITGCWEWAGAARLDAKNIPQPRVWLADERRSESLPRAVWLLSGRKTPAGKWTAWRTCCNPLCANPDHHRAGTKAQWGAWMAAKGAMRGDPRRVAMNTAIARQSRGRLTVELAQWIRESTQTGRAISQALGVPEQTISRARRGKTWRPTAVASSVFSLGLFMAASNDCGRKAA